jgi:hypothetical protein
MFVFAKWFGRPGRAQRRRLMLAALLGVIAMALAGGVAVAASGPHKPHPKPKPKPKHPPSSALTRDQVIQLIKQYAFTKPGATGAPGAPGAPTPVTAGTGLVKSGTTLSINTGTFSCPPYQFFFGLQKNATPGCDFPALAYSASRTPPSGPLTSTPPAATTIPVGTAGKYVITGYATLNNPTGIQTHVNCLLTNKAGDRLAVTGQDIPGNSFADVALTSYAANAAAGDTFSLACGSGSTAASYANPIGGGPSANVTAIPVSVNSSLQ